MRVLAVNKFFHPAGGAETVFLQTSQLLRRAGVEVAEFAMASPVNLESEWATYFARERRYVGGHTASRILDGAAAVYSLHARKCVRRLIRDFQPDVAHLHNVYHQLSLSIVDELAASGVPIVMTVHDYKPVCPNYTMLTHDGPCTRCVGGHFWNATRHRCIKGSLAGSLLATSEAYLNHFRRQWSKIGVFVVPSEFSAGVLAAGGIDRTKIVVARNAVEAAGSAKRSLPKEATFVYCGRLSTEKGLDVLLDASAKLVRGVVEIYGDGPLQSRLHSRVVRDGLPVRLKGRVPPDRVSGVLVAATAAVLPSQCHESGSRAILEAGAVGVPTIASASGASLELIDDRRDGVLVPPGDASALCDAMNRLASSPLDVAALGHRAWRRVQDHHRPSAYISRILSVYSAQIRQGGNG